MVKKLVHLQSEDKVWEKMLKSFYETHFSVSSQNVYTPFKLFDKIINSLNGLNNPSSILAFNIEAVYVLIKHYDISPDNIVVWCDNEYKAIMFSKLGVYKFIQNDFMVAEHIYNYKTRETLELKNMEFDAVFGNPAYDKNLHLKILEKAINYLNEDGTCVWIHPARWAQDPLGESKQNTDIKKFKYLPWKSFDVIPAKEANDLFGIGNPTDLVISILNKTVSEEEKSAAFDSVRFKSSTDKSIFNKIFTLSSNNSTVKSVIEEDKQDRFRIKINIIQKNVHHGGKDYMSPYRSIITKEEIFENGLAEDGRHWTECFKRNQFSKSIGDPIPRSIGFDTKTEAQNFINSFDTTIMKFINGITKIDDHLQVGFIPVMDDYTKPLSDEYFRNYFNLTTEELNRIGVIVKEEELKNTY